MNTTDEFTGGPLRLKCSDCNRTIEIALPFDQTALADRLANQRWKLSRVAYRAKPADQASKAIELLCPCCDEAWMRSPP